MRRERSAPKARLVLLVALASLLYAVGKPALVTGAVTKAPLPRCLPEGYGLEQAAPRSGDDQKAVTLTAGWATGAERRRACMVRTTISLTITGSGGVAASARWKVSARLDPWSSVVHTWVWRNWCADSQGKTRVKFSVPGRTVSQLIPDPPACVTADAASTVADLGTGTKYVKRPGDRITPHMIPKGTPPPLHWAVINPKSAWLVSDGYTLVAVYAGAPGEDPSLGRFAIIRQNEIFGIQYEPPDIVDVGKVGAVKITRAPRGKSRETSAQKGRLHFVAANGTKGVLDLTGDRVRVTRRG
jgi:hypothetical protein